MPESIVFNEDCMEVMRRYPDGYFDLTIADPPYGISITALHPASAPRSGADTHTHTHTHTARCSAVGQDRSAVQAPAKSSLCRQNFIPCSTIAPRRTQRFFGSWNGSVKN